MRIANKFPLLLAIVALLSASAVQPSGAQVQPRRAPARTQPSLDYETESARLRAPVPEDELQRFTSDLTTLVRALHDLNASHPEVQDRMIEAEQKIADLTPEQRLMFANAWDRPRLSQAAGIMRHMLKGLNQSGPVLSRPGIMLGIKAMDAAADPSQTNTLSVANYGPCTPTPAPSFLGVATPIPSDTGTDYGLTIGLDIANAAQIPLNFLCQEITVILGEGTNIPECIVAAIDQAIAFALQTTLQVNEFCDSNVLASENDAAYFNTIAIFNNLGADTTTIETQITEAQNELDTHITNVDSDINAHITAIDADIDKNVAAININGNANVSAITVDIDNHVAAANMDIDTRVVNADTDLNTHLTAVDTDIDTRLTAISATIGTGNAALQASIAALQSNNVRIFIERSLSGGNSIGLFETPSSQGGYLELVGTVVQTVITGLVASGQSVGSAQTYENQGNSDFAAKNYKAAYFDYMKAYQTAVR